MVIKKYDVTVLEQGQFVKEKVFSKSEYGVGIYGTTTCLAIPDDVKVNDVVILTHATRNINYVMSPDTESKVRFGVVTEVIDTEISTLSDLCTAHNIILKVLCSGDELDVDLSKLKGIKTSLEVLK